MVEQGERHVRDGAIEVRIVGDIVIIAATTNGERECIQCTPYNAWRVFAALAQILGAELPRKLLKTIRMG